jgi:hypothetical protein
MLLDLSPESWTLRDVYYQQTIRNLNSVRLPFRYQKSLIRVEVKADHPTLKPHYRRGGWISQIYGDSELANEPVPLNRTKILKLPNFGEGGYSLQFRPAGVYLVSFTLKVWEYRLDEPEFLLGTEVTEASEWFTSVPSDLL